jgi:four helix bundle protein
MLDAQQITLDLIRSLRPIAATLHSRNPALEDQLVRAATSIALNLGEGIRRTGRDKKRAYRIAAAEAQEVKSALEVACAWGHLDDAALEPVRALADRVARITYGLAR